MSLLYFFLTGKIKGAVIPLFVLKVNEVVRYTNFQFVVDP